MKKEANINVYLLLYQNDQILLSKRYNTGYEDGNWALISGQGEENESARDSIIRDAIKKIGIKISVKNLFVAHVMHRKSDKDNIDIFMTCDKWSGKLHNKDSDKCSELKFFPTFYLPKNVIPYIKIALEEIANKEFYSEYGWE